MILQYVMKSSSVLDGSLRSMNRSGTGDDTPAIVINMTAFVAILTLVGRERKHLISTILNQPPASTP